ncbi:MAG: PAS domain S-box protein [Candidatus Pacebacteria bacterium]|nr:PAS domain S-box protein [Candidatus Paceibacterota bacterium]
MNFVHLHASFASLTYMVEEKLSLELEHRKVREDLESLERYIEEFFEFLPLPVCMVNPVDVIIGVNRAFQDLTCYSEMEIVGKETNFLFLEKKRIKDLEEEILNKQKRITREMTLLIKDGGKIPVNVSGQFRRDEEGNLIGYFFALFDISVLKKFQEELEKKVKEKTKELEGKTKELEASGRALLNILEDIRKALKETEEEKNKTQAIITNFTDGLFLFDEKSNLVLVNPQAEVFFDIEARDLINKPILELSSIPSLASLVKLLGPEIKGIFRKELQAKENLVLEVSTISIIGGREEKLGTLVILHDVTREKRIERMKTEFVSIAAHQLRTPLSAIKWTLRMLLDGDLGGITEEQKNFIEKTYGSNERMIALINDLLSVARIEEGRYLYKPILTDIELVVKFVINSYKEESKKRGIKVEFKKTEKKLPLVLIDVEKMRLAIQNLFDNAIRYTRPDGKVTVSLKRVKKEIEVSIKDTGVGIPKNQQERVFTKFFRAANVMRMETEGSGLGLFITKNIIEAHGGKIWFESEEGESSTFHFTLPVKEKFGEFLKTG